MLDLRRQGHGFAEIAAHVGVSPATAYREVAHALHEMGRAQAAELLRLELERLDYFQQSITRLR